MKKVVRIILTVVLVAYLAVSVFMTGQLASDRLLKGVKVEINDSAQRRFVTAREIMKEIESLGLTNGRRYIAEVNTDSIERFLAASDKIESVTVVRLTNDSILVRVDPMVPVARVFEPNGLSYYINREGKHMKADARYHIDVPVIAGSFPDSAFSPTRLLPLIDYISASPTLSEMITMIKVDSPTDVILVPQIRGHVINFGEPDAFESKFARLKRIYRDVLPVKGWEYYDTLSVKWGGQVVATRRHKEVQTADYTPDEEEEDIDISTMLVGENVAPGRTRPGQKAHGERDIPAAEAKKKADQKQKVKETKTDSLSKKKS